MPATKGKTGVVLLAAGQGKRFGGDKLTAGFRGRPLWEWAAETAENVAFSERILVVGPDSAITGSPEWKLAVNHAPGRGMGTSIATGARALTDSDRVVIMLADMPLVSRAHIVRLLAAQDTAFTRYPDGSAGCPAIFTRSVFPLLETLSGDRGAKSLDLPAADLVAPACEVELADVDSARDLERLTSAD